jgi:isochorismate synthase
MRQIAKYEQFPRQYYGGYCGPMLSPQSFNLFVTLRCMQVDTESRQYHLYVGGGITAKSTPESEWRETCFKAQTLLNLIPND